MSVKETARAIKKNKRKLITLGIFFITGVLWLMWGYTPQSTLRWVSLSELGVSLKEVCAESRQIYPPISLDWPFPARSPDKNYYLEIANGRRMGSKWIKVFRSDTKQEIGTYYSSYSSLFVHCWDKDSSGVYVSDYKPGGTGYGGIFTPHSKIGPVKKLLVPE